MKGREYLRIWFFLFLLVSSCALHEARKSLQAATIKSEASELVSAGEYEGALKLLRFLEEEDKNDPEVYSMLGECLWHTGDFLAAVKNFEASLRLDYGNWRTHMLLALMLMENGKTGRALTEFELGARYGDKEALAHYNYGLALYEMGKLESALTQWKLAYDLDKSNAKFAAALGMGLSEGDELEALSYFEKADELGADSFSFHHNYGLLLVRLKKFQRAQEQFMLALEKKPKDRECLSNLGSLYMRMNEYPKALPLWEKLSGRFPEDRTFRVYLARAYLETGSYRQAIAVLEDEAILWEKEIAKGSKNPHGRAPGLDKALEILALSYKGAGDPEKGLRYMGRALKLSPSDVNHLVNYGVFLAESGMIKEARKQWEKALKLDPGNETARKNLAGTEGQP